MVYRELSRMEYEEVVRRWPGPALGQQGLPVKYTTLRRFVRRARLARAPRRTVRMAETAPWEVAFHAYTGVPPVLMPSRLRVTPARSESACRRRPIPRLSRGRSLLRESSRPPHAVGTCSAYRPPRRVHGQFPRSGHPFSVAVGPHFPPELMRATLGPDTYPQPQLVPVLGRPVYPHGPVGCHDGFRRAFAFAVHGELLRAVGASDSCSVRFYPRFTD